MDSKIASRAYFRFWRMSRQIGARSALIAIFAIIPAVIAPFLADLVPEGFYVFGTTGSVAQLLPILASSMLAVTIFALSVILSARQAASSQVTPRSHQVLMEDRVTQNVLSTFLGSFIFSLIGLIFLGLGVYEGPSVTVILFFTIIVFFLVIAAIIRWITHIAELGSVTATSRKIEAVAKGALRARRELPCLGARPLTPGQLEIPARAQSYKATETGYVQHIDLKALSSAAKRGEGNVYVVVQPGELVSPGEVLAFYTATLDDSLLQSAFTMADRRVFEQDPRFGVIVLSEIAQRALSPGVNDPGTAIDILARLARVLDGFQDEMNTDIKPELPHVWMSSVTAEELIRDGFDPIIRDGAGVLEVQVRLFKTLALLSQSGDDTMTKAAQAAASRALKIVLPQQLLPEHCDRLKSLAEDV